MRKFIIGVSIMVVGSIILYSLGFNRGQEISMRDNYQDAHFEVTNIYFDDHRRIYDISAAHVVSGAIVSVATDDLVRVPLVFKSGIDEYLKDNSLSVEELKKAK